MDLSRYDRKKVRIRTEDGKIFAGRAAAYPSGYGLHEFDRPEESIRIRNVYIFLSEIKTIDEIPERILPSDDPDRYDDLLDYLVNDVPCWIADILPRQVPEDAAGQYFAVDRCFRQPERMTRLRRKMTEIILKLNCYYDAEYSFDPDGAWEMNPDPENAVRRLEALPDNRCFRALLPAQQTLLEIDPTDTYMSVWTENDEVLAMIRELAAAEGLFFRRAPDGP